MNNKAIYDDLRSKALEIQPEDLGIRLENETQVYAALIDFKTNNRLVTLFCTINGDVSLYFSDAVPAIGLGQSELIQKKAISFLISSG